MITPKKCFSRTEDGYDQCENSRLTTTEIASDQLEGDDECDVIVIGARFSSLIAAGEDEG
jgi:hypothetical protein